MPNHIHLILYFHQEKHLSDYLRDFKKYTSTHIRKMIESDGNIELLEKLRYTDRKQKFRVWMERFDDVVIRSRNVMLIKVNYIHWNPVKRGLATYPEEYPHFLCRQVFRPDAVFVYLFVPDAAKIKKAW